MIINICIVLLSAIAYLAAIALVVTWTGAAMNRLVHTNSTIHRYIYGILGGPIVWLFCLSFIFLIAVDKIIQFFASPLKPLENIFDVVFDRANKIMNISYEFFDRVLGSLEKK